jgi:hypothetical protein
MVVVLVLMAGLGAMALAAAAAAMTTLALAGHQQTAQNAFEASETGIAEALFEAAAARDEGTAAGTVLPDDWTARAAYRTGTREATGAGALPDGFTIGENDGSFGARHFFVTSDGDSGRGARVRLEQGFYLVVPNS